MVYQKQLLRQDSYINLCRYCGFFTSFSQFVKSDNRILAPIEIYHLNGNTSQGRNEVMEFFAHHFKHNYIIKKGHQIMPFIFFVNQMLISNFWKGVWPYQT